MIRQATEADIYYFFGQRGLSVPPNPLVNLCLVVSCSNASMLLIIAPIDDEQAEVHICCPRQSVRRLRELCAEGFDYCKAQGFTKLYTTTDKRQIIDNTVKKLGFIYVTDYNDSKVHQRSL